MSDDRRYPSNDLQKGYQPLKEGYQPNDNPPDPAPPTGGSALGPIITPTPPSDSGSSSGGGSGNSSSDQ